MDNLITQLEEITFEALNQLDYMDADQISMFVDKRESIVMNMQELLHQDTTLDQRARVMQVLNHEHLFLARMELLRQEASDSIQQLERAKIRRSAYELAYAPESAFFDKRN
ncbi:hypothetical protein [Paenibacillus sp. KN14-4R]|uniref:hypothetical protein n=1 Tax=Paenibacillus sp. KN14-4R TaxID=3445773 RepID=UPI003F9FC205